MYQKKLASRIIIYNEDYYNTRIFKEKNMLALIWYNERCPLINKRLSFDFNIFVIEWLSPCGKEESTRKCVVKSMRRADNQFDGYQEEKRLTSHSFKSIWIVLLTLNWMREQIRKRVVHIARDIFIFQQDNATVLARLHISLTWQYSTYELMGGDTLTWFRDLLRPLFKEIEC